MYVERAIKHKINIKSSLSEWSNIKYLKAFSKIFYDSTRTSLFRCQKADKVLKAKSKLIFQSKTYFLVKPQECLEDYNVYELVYKHFDGKSKSNAYKIYFQLLLSYETAHKPMWRLTMLWLVRYKFSLAFS